MFAPRIPTTERSRTATILVAHLPDSAALLAAMFDNLPRLPPRRRKMPALDSLLPMSGHLAVARTRPFPYAAVPDLSMAIPCPVTGHPNMAGHSHGTIRNDARRRRRPDMDAERSIADAKANIRAVSKRQCRKQRDCNGCNGWKIPGGFHVVFLLSRTQYRNHALMNKVTHRQPPGHPQNCKPRRPFVSGYEHRRIAGGGICATSAADPVGRLILAIV